MPDDDVTANSKPHSHDDMPATSKLYPSDIGSGTHGDLRNAIRQINWITGAPIDPRKIHRAEDAAAILATRGPWLQRDFMFAVRAIIYYVERNITGPVPKEEPCKSRRRVRKTK